MFCSKCGTQVPEGTVFCHKCGAKIYEPAQAQNQLSQQSTQQSSSDDKVMGVLSYLSILLLIPLIKGSHKTSDFVKFHLNQGIVLSIAFIAASILSTISPMVLAATWDLGLFSLLNGVVYLLYLALFVLSIIGLIGVACDKTTSLPLVCKIKILK